jgi:hypothetical protein
VPEAARTVALAAAETLLRQLATSPYFRDGGQLAYTLRGHVRGFLEDPAHPLARHLLRFLAAIALEGGPAGMRHLLAWADATCLRPEAPAVSAAVAYTARRHQEQLLALASGPESAQVTSLRARSGDTAMGAAEADRLRDGAVAAALAAWGAAPTPPDEPHSM